MDMKAINRKTFKTFFGAILSVIFYIFMVFNVIYFLSYIGDTKNPQISIGTEYLNEYTLIDMTKSLQIPGFGIVLRPRNQIVIKQSEEIKQHLTPINSIYEYDYL